MIETAPAKLFIQVPEVSPAGLSEVNVEPTHNPAVPQLDILVNTHPLTMASRGSKTERAVTLANAILDSVPDRFKTKDRRGRGPCPGCLSGSEDNHHFGSKCTRRRQQSIVKAFTSSLACVTTINKLNLITSGLSQFFLKRGFTF